ncbi:hypothetical protein Zmor_021057 [Zophobas morio]|uniref:Uncharacterized protein n=1 Tax=Zophobas morio TaxID=2755281 RepID=A0AA38I561_9CUCU|nr:hypothetical protein Zmor_021057 [Zophobas morio]
MFLNKALKKLTKAYICRCPLVALSDRVHCRVHPGDPSKEYPECCFEVRCNENNRTMQVYGGFVNATAVDMRRKEKQEKEEKIDEKEDKEEKKQQ